MVISSAALSSISDRVDLFSVDVVESALLTIVSKHAIEARAKAISDVPCCSFGKAAST